MSVSVFSGAVLVASNDSAAGGVDSVSCVSQAIDVSGLTQLGIQLVICEIWGPDVSGTKPALSITVELSYDGVHFTDGALGIISMTESGAWRADTQVLAEVARVRATFDVPAGSPLGMAAVHFGVSVMTGSTFD